MNGKMTAVTEFETVENDIYRNVGKVFLTLRDLFIIVTLLFFLLRMDSFLFLRGMLPVPPIYLMAAWVFAIGVLGMLSTMFERNYIGSIYRCLPILLPFIAIVAISWIGIFAEQAYYFDNYKYLLMPTLDFGLFVTGILIGTMRMRKGVLSTCMAVALVVIIATSFIDIVYPGTFSKVANRAAGIFENPGGAAFNMVFLTAVLLRWEKKALNIPDLLLFVICGVAVFFTFSRGGAVQFIALAALYWMNMTTRHRFYAVIQFLIVVVLLAAGVFYILPDYISQLKILEYNSDRLGWFLGNVGGAFTTKDDRVVLFWEAAGIISANPLTGVGTGFVGSMNPGPHNVFLARWIENGIFGLLAFVWLLASLFFMNKFTGNFNGVAALMIVFLYGLSSHIVMDDRVILLVMAIITSRAIANRASQKAKPDKA